MTNDKSRFSPFLKQCFVTSAVGINLIGHGSLMGFPAVLLPQLHQKDSDIISSKTMDSWIASVLAVTMFLGSFLAPPIMDRLGRKMTHYIVSASSVIGWFIAVLAGNIEVILLARIIGGLSFGILLPLRSILIGEYSSPKNRGAFLTTVSLTQGLGIFFVHLIGSLLSWRKTSLICLFLPLTSLIMTFFMPESPSYMVSRGRYDECREVFRWLRGDEEEKELDAMIQARMDFEKTSKTQKKLSILDNIRKQEFYKPIILMLHVYTVAQISGASVTATFSTTIIKLIMNPNVNADVWMVVLDTERIIVNTLAVYIINKVKRRTMVLATGGLCIASLVAIAGYVYAKTSGILTHDILWIPGALMIIHFFTFAVGIIPLPSVIAGEVFPLQYRSIAGTISLVSISGNMFLVLKTFPSLVGSVGISGAYMLYAGVLTYCMIVIWYLLPETKDRTLQDIEDEYRGQVRVKDAEEMQALQNNTKEKDESNITEDKKNNITT